MDKNSLLKLEYDKIQEQLARQAYSEPGKKQALNWQPISDVEKIEEYLDETEEAMDLLRYSEPSFLSQLTDISSILKKARVAGMLHPFELLQVYYVLRASRLAAKYTAPRGDKLKRITDTLVMQSSLEKQINRVIDEEGSVNNDASSSLKSIRAQIDTHRQRIKDYLQNFIRSSSNQNKLQDTIITERAGRYVVPVKQEYRNDIKGIVHDESASGATVFIEPLPVVESNNHIRSLEVEEKREVERLLRDLSAEVSLVSMELAHNARVLTRLDVIFARAHLAFAMNAFRPLMNKEGIIALEKARHPLLGEDAVHINVELGRAFDVLVITGPNTGGKTVVLKTIGLLTVMAMSGLFIPAQENSKVGIFEKIFVDIGDEQSIEQSLSTFSSHMQNIINMLEQVDNNSLVLLDELGAGTDPQEGSALGRAILEEMQAKNARVVVTTHQSELKTYAFQNQRVENACVEFDPLTLQPTYELTIGTPGQSNAFEIARRLGLDQRIVNRARDLVPEREAEMGNMIRSLRESRYYYEQGSKELSQAQRKLKEEKKAFEREKEAFTKQQEEILSKARTEADVYVRQVKREANEAVDELKEILKQEQRPKWHEVEQKHRRLKKMHVPAYETEVEEKKSNTDPIKPGDYVFISTVQQKGYVLSGPNVQGELMVQVGIMKLTVHKDQCMLTQSEEEKSSKVRNQILLEKVGKISPELDLRGRLSADALIELDQYLEDANLAGLSQVRIIHGKGTGALRKAVRGYLKNHRYVDDYRDGERTEGGFGVTVVKLKS